MVVEIDNFWLEEKYIIKNLSLKQIAIMRNCGVSTISRRIKKFGIKKKKYIYGKYKLTESFLLKEYNKNKKSQKEIALLVGCSQVLIQYYMKKFGIKTRATVENFLEKGHPMTGRENKWGLHKEVSKQKISKALLGSKNPRWGIPLTKKQKKHLSFMLSGIKNPMWGKRGINAPAYKRPEERKTKLYEQIRNSSLGKKWTRECYNRDKYTCQKCGDKKGGNLNAHHILQLNKIVKKYYINTLEKATHCQKLWDISNGVTLCEICHRKIHLKK